MLRQLSKFLPVGRAGMQPVAVGPRPAFPGRKHGALLPHRVPGTILTTRVCVRRHNQENSDEKRRRISAGPDGWSAVAKAPGFGYGEGDEYLLAKQRILPPEAQSELWPAGVKWSPVCGIPTKQTGKHGIPYEQMVSRTPNIP